MPIAVCGALCKCSFGTAPSSLSVIPKNPVFACGLPVVSIADMIPMVNIMTFGMCSTMTNPTVASATAAALGVLTPMPCIPATVAPWLPSKPIVIMPTGPVVCSGDMCTCMWGGMISITMPGQFTVL
ncbi:MAG: DUF4280 domain-containing protein [Holosporales bacterium]|nr:DUF4280 domain-containing protein [Holosporales bacterium]